LGMGSGIFLPLPCLPGDATWPRNITKSPITRVRDRPVWSCPASGSTSGNGRTGLESLPPEVVDNLNRQIGAVANSTSKAANRAGSQLILSELAANWLEWAAKRYKSPQTAKNLRSDILPLLQMFGSEIVETVGPRRLADYQARLAATGRNRQGILKATAHCLQMFAWGVAMEMVNPTHLMAIRAMQPLRYGAINAPESKPRQVQSAKPVFCEETAP
jgi:hypothetical protein